MNDAQPPLPQASAKIDRRRARPPIARPLPSTDEPEPLPAERPARSPSRRRDPDWLTARMKG